MGSLSNLYISQSYISLIHLGSNNTASSTPTELQDGLGNGVGVSVSTNNNLYVSGNIYAANLTGSANDTSSFVTTASFNAYTQSNDSKVNSLIAATASYAISSSVKVVTDGLQTQINGLATTSSLNTLSASIYSTDSTQSNLINGKLDTSSFNTFSSSVNTSLSASTFFSGTQYKADSSSFNSRIDSIQPTGYVTTSSFNSYTQSTDNRLNSIESFTASVSTSVGLLQTFSSSQYKTDSSSFDSRIDSIEGAGYVTSAITASSLITASVSQSTITFTKGDGSTFNIVVADVSGSQGSFVTTASFNSYTASQDFLNTTFATTSSVNTLSSSIYQTDATQSYQITANALTASNSLSSYSSSQSTLNNTLSSSIASVSSSLNTFSSSYKVDSSSFDNRINSLTAVSGGYLTTASFNSYTQSVSQSFETQSFLNGTFATTSSVNTLSSSIFQTDSTQSNLINGKLDTSSFTIFSTSVDSRLDSIEFLDTTFATTASVNTLSASIYQTDSTQSNNISALSSSNAFAHSTFATTGSNTFVGNQIVNGAISASGNISASSLYVTNATIINLTTVYETSSVIYSSGSNQFGDSLSDVQILSGSVQIVGGLTLNGANISTQSFVDLGPLNQFTASQIVSNSYFATTSSVDNLSASVYQTDSTQSNQISANSQSAATSFSASNASITSLSSSLSSISGAFATSISASGASVVALSSSIYTTDSNQQNQINSLINATASYAISSSVKVVTDGLQNQINTLSTTASVNALSESIFQTDATQSNNIASNSSSIGLLQTFSGSQYKSDSSSFDTRIDNLEFASGTFVTTASFNSYTQSVSDTIATLATTASVNTLSASIYQTDATQSNNISSLTSKTGSYATTGSNNFVGNQNITGSLNVTGSIIATTTSSFFNNIVLTNNVGSLKFPGGGLTATYLDKFNEGTLRLWTNDNLAASYLQFGFSGNTVTIGGNGSGIFYVPGTFVQGSLSASANISSSTLSGMGNVTLFSSSVDSRINGIVAGTNFVTTASFNSYTASQDFKNTTFATTGSNTFNGNQIVNGFISASESSSFKQIVLPTGVAAGLGGLAFGTDTFLDSIGGSKPGIRIFNSGYNTAWLQFGYSSTPVKIGTDGNDFLIDTSTKISGSITASGDISSSGNIYAANLTGSTIDTGSLVTTASFNTYTASQDFKNTTFATTGSNTFSGSQTINGNVNITGSLTASGLKYPNTDGLSGQFIVTDGVGTLAFDDVHVLLEDVRYGENITLGDPLYVSGSNGNRPVVFKADAAVSAKMPVIYIAKSTAVANTNTTAITLGLITGVTTTGYAAGTTIYVAEGGGWSQSRPSGSTSIVQPLGIVTKEGAGGSGRGLVLNPGPAFLPNLQTGYAWVGNGSNQPVEVTTSSFATNVSGYVTTSSFNSYTSSQDFKNTTFATTSSVTDLSASIYQTDATQSTNIASNSSSIGLLQTFSGSQYKADSASFDTRLLASGGQSQIQDEGTILGNVTSFNFNGAGVTASVSAGTASITIAGGGGTIDTGSFITTGSITNSQTIFGNLTVSRSAGSGFNAIDAQGNVNVTDTLTLGAIRISGSSAIGAMNMLYPTTLWGASGNVSFTNYLNVPDPAYTGSISFTASSGSGITLTANGGANVTINGVMISSGNSGGSTSIGIGSSSLQLNRSSANVAVGIGNLRFQTFTGNGQNTAIGHNALNILGSGSAAAAAQLNNNTAVGNSTGLAMIVGARNTFIGSTAGTSADNVERMTGVGRGALTAIGSNNTINGSGSKYNTAIGHNALFSIQSGSNNTMIHGGSVSGEGFITGSNNNVVGMDSGLPSSMEGNTIIGRGITGLSSPLTNNVILADGKGNIALQKNGTTGSVRIGTGLEVTGSSSFTGSVSIASTFQLQLPSGSNQQTGLATLDGGTPASVVVTNSKATANSIIMLTKQSNATAGTVSISSKGSGTFTIESTGVADADVVAFMIINPS